MISTKDLINKVAEEQDCTKKHAREMVKAIIGATTDLLVDNGEIRIQNLGTLRTKEVGAREGRNPQTGEKIMIEANTQVYLRASKALKEAVN